MMKRGEEQQSNMKKDFKQKYIKRKPLNSKNHNKQIKFKISPQKYSAKLLPHHISASSEDQQDNLKFKDKQRQNQTINQKNQKQFQNISYIAQKNQGQSFISNKQDSLDGIDQFFIYAEGEEMIQNQKQQDQASPFSSFQEDWTYLEKQYQNTIQVEQKQSVRSQSYFQMNINKDPNLNQILLKQNNRKRYPFLTQSYSNIFLAQCQSTQYLNCKNKQKKQGGYQSIHESLKGSYEKLNSLKQKKNMIQNANIMKNAKNAENTEMLLIQSQPSQRQLSSQKLFKTFQNQSQKNILNYFQNQQIEEEDQQFAQNQSQNPLQNYEESQFIEGQNKMQTSAEAFIKFVSQGSKDKLKGDYSQIQLANISKIMKAQSIWKQNKSQEQQNKQKQDDEVVAMLQNQLRGNQRIIKDISEESKLQINKKIKRNVSSELILKQLEEEQIYNQAPDFNLAISMRQKWIQSQNDRSEQWKSYQIDLLQKIKRIMRNPYIEWDQQQQTSK